MGWLTDAKNWAQTIWQHEKVSSAVNYTYQTIAYCFDQIAVIPRVIHSIFTHAPTQMVTKHLLHVAAQDLIPLVFVTYCNQLIQDRGRAYLDDEPNAAWISTYTAVQVGLYFLQTATWIIQVNRKTEMMVRMAIVTIEASPMLKGGNTSSPMTVCTEPPQPCTTLRFMQGSIRDLVAFWSTEAAISLMGYIPVAGGSIAALLAVYHNGRYVLTVALPDLCNRHQMVYLSEHSELALSLGVGHVASSWLVNSLVETATGIPRIFYANAIKQFMLITHMSVATHLKLPDAKKATTRVLIDPLYYFQGGVGFTVDILLLGLKTKIPRMLKGSDNKGFKDVWKNLTTTEYKYLALLNEKIPMNHLARIVFPRLVHSTQDFIHDPVIFSNWTTVRTSLVNTLQIIESLHEELVVQAARYAPDTAARLVASIFGAPKFVAKLLLQLISDKEVIEQLRAWRYQLEKFNLVVLPAPVTIDEEALLLPGQTRAAPSPPPLPLADQTSSTLPEAENVIRLTTTVPTSLTLPAAQDVIRRRNVGLPSAANTIPPRHVIRFHAPKTNPSAGRSTTYIDEHTEIDSLHMTRR